ncbi:MAG: hypothetical protein K9N49_00615 [Candidatus Marinimicrobia bacterium]|nr:hypothetical protein [Candidatus Neomarinimicrobiota bacterium]
MIEFLNKYNPMRTRDKALSSAIMAAVQHNSLYRRGLSTARKADVIAAWKECLVEIAKRYRIPQAVDTYENDIQTLRDNMNREFSDAFYSQPHERYHTDPGFRISHAQKSISVFLKHLWCMNDVATPPQCPVDSRILKAAGKRYPDTKWGYVNSLADHREKIAHLIRAKGDDRKALAEWELDKFRI